MVITNIPTLKQLCFQSLQNHINNFEYEKEMFEKEISELKNEILDLKNRLEQQEQRWNEQRNALVYQKTEFAKQRQIVIIGQVAFIFEKAIRSYVFDNRPSFQTLSRIQKLYETKQLSADEMDRWKNVIKFFISHNWSLFIVIDYIRYLKDQRLSVAHGSDVELGTVTMSQLENWSKELLNSEQYECYKPFLSMLTQFTEDHKPLILKTNLSHVFEN